MAPRYKKLPKASENKGARFSPEFFSETCFRILSIFVSPTVGSPSVKKIIIGSSSPARKDWQIIIITL